jgi:hypothetical protein
MSRRACSREMKSVDGFSGQLTGNQHNAHGQIIRVFDPGRRRLSIGGCVFLSNVNAVDGTNAGRRETP